MDRIPSPLLTLPGAVEAEAPDVGVAAHYGNPFAEQRRLSAGAGFVDLSHRGVVRVRGADRLAWMHLLTSQHLSGLPADQAAEALILSPHGHVEHALYVVDDGEDSLWMHVEPGTTEALIAYLASMVFMYRVQVEDLTGEYVLVHEPLGAPAPTPVPEGAIARVAAYGRELFLPRGELAAYAERRGDPAGMWAYEALRIADHRPRLGLETDHRTIPHEVGWLETAVHLNKGCYRGQETVARVHNLGRPPRRLVFLHLDGSQETLPPHGAPVEAAGRQVGFVTSSAQHFELGPIALALVKRTAPADADLLAGGVAAAQEPVVAEREPQAPRPNLTVLRPPGAR